MNLNCMLVTSTLRFSLTINPIIFSWNLCFDLVFNDMGNELFYPIKITLICHLFFFFLFLRNMSSKFVGKLVVTLVFFPNLLGYIVKKQSLFCWNEIYVDGKGRREKSKIFFFLRFFLSWLKIEGLGGPGVFQSSDAKI